MNMFKKYGSRAGLATLAFTVSASASAAVDAAITKGITDAITEYGTWGLGLAGAYLVASKGITMLKGFGNKAL